MHGNKSFIHEEFVQLPFAVRAKPVLARHTALEVCHARDFTANVERFRQNRLFISRNN
jgi:hypothetical protein